MYCQNPATACIGADGCFRETAAHEFFAHPLNKVVTETSFLAANPNRSIVRNALPGGRAQRLRCMLSMFSSWA
jgi:hypothetical protein